MTWLAQLGAELEARGIAGAEHRRILAELRDHIESEPACEARLGDPHTLARAFADELATARTRTCALRSFGALAAVAAVLALSQLSLAPAGGYPGFDTGLSLALFIPGALAMLVAPQFALVAGTLAALRALTRRRATALPAAELALIRRRASVALAAGLATVAGLELYVIDFSARLPVWWLALIGGLTGVAGAELVAECRRLSRARTIRSDVPGPAGDVYDDLPPLRRSWLRRHPWRLGALASLGAGVAIAAFTGHAEHSLVEGVERGLFEAVAAALGFAALGKAIGVAPPAAVAEGLGGSPAGGPPPSPAEDPPPAER
jgi:hypothetical protein